jgi:hypothetical protein
MRSAYDRCFGGLCFILNIAPSYASFISFYLDSRLNSSLDVIFTNIRIHQTILKLLIEQSTIFVVIDKRHYLIFRQFLFEFFVLFCMVIYHTHHSIYLRHRLLY